MEHGNVPYLCGGIYFLLLTQIKKNKRTKRQIRDLGGHDNNNTDVLADLITMFDSDFQRPQGRTFDSETTAYKSCLINSSTDLPFDEKSLIDGFDRLVKNCYQSALMDMHDFIQTRISCDGHFPADGLNHGQWLLQALLELISGDCSIAGNDRFYVLESGEPISKDELLRKDSYCLDSMLLGIWHYILTKRTLDNEKGRDTYIAWNKKPGLESERAQWKLRTGIGRSYPRKVEYYRWKEDNAENLFETGTADELTVCEKQKDKYDGSVIQKNKDVFERDRESGYGAPEEDAVFEKSKEPEEEKKNSSHMIEREDNNLFSAFGKMLTGRDYYNIFIGFNPFERNHFTVTKDRALTEYINDEMRDRVLPLTAETMADIKNHPALIAEECIQRDAAKKYGVVALITDVVKREQGYEIYFRKCFSVSMEDVWQYMFELGISYKTEFTRTHWAVKQIDLLEVLQDAQMLTVSVNVS